jgi:hypothetical protein
MAAQAAGVRVHTTCWVNAEVATAVARRARKLAGDSPDVATAMEAIAQAAADYRVKLTPNDVAISRARATLQAIDSQLEAMMAGGMLRMFNAEYKRRRMKAAANGQGFLSFRVATVRLRQAIVPHLIQGRSINRSLFEEVFR